jgi:hypothetical protein
MAYVHHSVKSLIDFCHCILYFTLDKNTKKRFYKGLDQL